MSAVLTGRPAPARGGLMLGRGAPTVWSVLHGRGRAEGIAFDEIHAAELARRVRLRMFDRELVLNTLTFLARRDRVCVGDIVSEYVCFGDDRELWMDAAAVVRDVLAGLERDDLAFSFKCWSPS